MGEDTGSNHGERVERVAAGAAEPPALSYDQLHGAEELLLQYLSTKPEETIPTGIRMLDHALQGGLKRKGLYTIAARTGEAKTSLALSIARRMALEQQVAVLYMSLEMSKHELIERLICQATLLPLPQVEQARVEGTLSPHVTRLKRKLASAWFHIEDLRGASLLELEALWQEMQASERKPDVLVIDHLQTVTLELGKGASRADAMSQYMADLKRFAKQKNLCIIVCCQINRQGVEKPSLIHLKSSGGIEENSDVVMIGARQNYDSATTEEDRQGDCDYELLLAKHRRGPKCSLTLLFRPPCFEFLEPTPYGARHPALETEVQETLHV